MLDSMKLSLQQNPVLTALEQNTHAISSYLGPPIFLSLGKACQIGSTRLLDWIWIASPTRVTNRTSSWSLTNYLRTLLSMGILQVARSCLYPWDLPMVKWLFEHFSGCEAPESVAANAIHNGNLSVLQFLWTHRAMDRGLSEQQHTTVHTECTVRFQIPWGEATWGARAIQKAIENDQLLECLSNLGSDDRNSAIVYALEIGDIELAQFLLPAGKCVLDYATGSSHVNVIEWVFYCGYLHRDISLAASTVPKLISQGSLELVQQIVQLHSPLPERHEDWKIGWIFALKAAVVRGDARALQWFIAHPLASETHPIFTYPDISTLVSFAAREGHVAVIQILYDQGMTDGSVLHLVDAVERGHLACVRWLLEHYSYPEYKASGQAIDKAAEFGHLEILQFFYALDSMVDEAARAKRRRLDTPDSWWAYAKNPIYWAAKGGHLAVLEWIQANRSQNVMQWTERRTMDIWKWSSGCIGIDPRVA